MKPSHILPEDRGVCRRAVWPGLPTEEAVGRKVHIAMPGGLLADLVFCWLLGTPYGDNRSGLAIPPFEGIANRQHLRARVRQRRTLGWTTSPVAGSRPVHGHDLRRTGGCDRQRRAGDSIVVHLSDQQQEGARRPDLYVAALGVWHYQDTRFNLRYAAKDAEDLVAFWHGQEERFGAVHTLLLTDTAVTREVLSRVRQFLTPAQIDDQVLIFLAGPGLLDARREYYFGTHDIDFNDPVGRGLSYDALESLFDGLAARWKLLLVDTCHAGEVDPELRRSTGTAVIAASGGEEGALERDGNGVFTFAVLAGLTNAAADLDHDGRVQVAELQAFVTQHVARLTDGRQTPTA